VHGREDVEIRLAEVMKYFSDVRNWRKNRARHKKARSGEIRRAGDGRGS
jgi:hypothetical protein